MWIIISSSGRSFSCRNRCFYYWNIYPVISFSSYSLINSFLFVLLSPAHWSVRIDFVLLRIDNWSSSESVIVKVDSTAKSISPSAVSANICGLNSYSDSTTVVSTNFTHSANTMKITITTNLAKGNYIESFGIYNLVVLVDYVSNFL